MVERGRGNVVVAVAYATGLIGVFGYGAHRPAKSAYAGRWSR
ncbi:hypothetical protein AB0945_26320 [Streptomyces sp. NPDC005474]